MMAQVWLRKAGEGRRAGMGPGRAYVRGECVRERSGVCLHPGARRARKGSRAGLSREPSQPKPRPVPASNVRRLRVACAAVRWLLCLRWTLGCWWEATVAKRSSARPANLRCGEAPAQVADQRVRAPVHRDSPCPIRKPLWTAAPASLFPALLPSLDKYPPPPSVRHGQPTPCSPPYSPSHPTSSTSSPSTSPPLTTSARPRTSSPSSARTPSSTTTSP